MTAVPEGSFPLRLGRFDLGRDVLVLPCLSLDLGHDFGMVLDGAGGSGSLIVHAFG